MADHQNGSAIASASGNRYKIDFENFRKRLKSFYSHWREHKYNLWAASDVVAIATPPPSDDRHYLKSSAFNIWMLGYEFTETIMVFMNRQIHFLCSQKKANLLGTLKESAKEAVGADVVIHVKVKNDDGIGLMEEILLAVRTQLKSDSVVVGYIAREAPERKLLETWSEKLSSSGFQLSNVTNGFSELFAVKDDSELTCVKKAAYLTSSVMKNFVYPKLEKIIDEENKVSHSSLMDDTEKVILDPLKVKVELEAEKVDICYPPIFQSGGEFDLRPSASSNDDDLYYDSTSVILCAIGSRYNSYCSNVARTYLIDANPMQRKAYKVLHKAHDAAIAALKSGNKVSAAYQAAVAVVEKVAPEILRHLTKTAGTGIGLEFRESGYSLNSTNDRVVKAGMVFNVSLGFENLQAQTKNPKTEKFSLLVADTVVVVGCGHPPEVLTQALPTAGY